MIPSNKEKHPIFEKKRAFFYLKREKTSSKHEVLHEKLKTVLPVLVLKKSRHPTSQNFKTHKTYVVQRFLSFKYTSVHKLYTIFLSGDLKTKKLRHQHQYPQNKTKKIFVIKSEILIKTIGPSSVLL